MNFDNVKTIFGLQGVALEESKEYEGKPSEKVEFWFDHNASRHVLSMSDKTLSAIMKDDTDQLAYGLHPRSGGITNVSVYIPKQGVRPVVAML